LTQELNQLKTCLAEGYPFVFGFTVYESFHSAKVTQSGIVPFPSKNEKAYGGHAVLAVGYDDAKKSFLVRNSWGPSWGANGYCWMPYSYLTSQYLSSDFWTIRQTTSSGKPAPKPRQKGFWEKVKDFFFPPTRALNS
jgi:C1A family cysteine protease